MNSRVTAYVSCLYRTWFLFCFFRNIIQMQSRYYRDMVLKSVLMYVRFLLSLYNLRRMKKVSDQGKVKVVSV